MLGIARSTQLPAIQRVVFAAVVELIANSAAHFQPQLSIDREVAIVEDFRCRWESIMRFISSREEAPLPTPKLSHARLRGSSVECTKKPPPTIALLGLFNLKRNSSPAASDVNDRVPPGCQKLTS